VAELDYYEVARRLRASAPQPADPWQGYLYAIPTPEVCEALWDHHDAGKTWLGLEAVAQRTKTRADKHAAAQALERFGRASDVCTHYANQARRPR
jgi:hypothetical protein